MTSLSERIELISIAMEGVTPGRWGQFHPNYAPEAIGAPFSTWDSSHDLSAIKDGKKIGRVATFKHSADAAYVDACNPVAISELLAAARKAEALQRENAEMREALQNLMGCYDTPLSRRRFPPDDFMSEALNIARTLLNGGSDAQG